MNKITIVKSMAAPLLMGNIDTDIISPMAALTSGSSANPFNALKDYAFAGIRYLNGDVQTKQPNPEFALNDPIYSDAKILITGENFGCGSSRETAPAGIHALGIRCLIGTTFGDIFFNNCYQCGILPIRLDREQLEELIPQCRLGEFIVNLESQKITTPEGELFEFEINEFRKFSLLKGLDDISMTLEQLVTIKRFQEKDRRNRPWIYPPITRPRY